MDNIFYTQAIQQLRPGEGFTINDTDYSTLKFTNDNVEKPSEEEIQVVFQRLLNEYNVKEYQRLRALEYPPIQDYVDAVVKGDQQQIQAYINACLAVKAKYPKPE